MQGGTRIAKHNHRSVLSKVALGAELTTYISSNIAFLGMIRLDFIANAHVNAPYSYSDTGASACPPVDVGLVFFTGVDIVLG
jgi:hypothetical protein